jgi:uncharacterized glyoxalase superfamily protein PhnB
MSEARLSSCAIVLVTPDLPRAAQYYHEVLGFRVVEPPAEKENFAALYRDSVEIILVQSQKGIVLSNRTHYGAGFDAYLVPESISAVQSFYEEILAKGASILQPPGKTVYGSLEFVFTDLDGHQIGVGRVIEEALFFGSSASAK